MEQINIEVVSPATAARAPEDEWEQLARRDPLTFLKRCRDHYDEHYRDYRCTFVKQERVGDKLTPEEWSDVRFREEPYSVDMTWTHNAGLAGRALYVEGRWTEGDKEMAWVRPAGVLVKWMKLKQWIHGKLAGRASRRTIDQFGFRNSLDLIIHYSEKARREGKLELVYIGLGQIEDRPAYVFERWLPYTGQEEPYPDRLLQVYIDREWLVPICCLSYADDDANELLGKYVLKDVEMNPGYTDADFDPEAIGF
ncbi:MAG: DUF1571 domain-containing protein [Phycisphaerales bacterium]|nr:MAG: DUF1571 domain-containing protein [Phycisphaerales bacterium]